MNIEQIKNCVTAAAEVCEDLNCAVSLFCEGESARMSFGGLDASDELSCVVDGAGGLLCGLSVIRLCEEERISTRTPAHRFISARELPLDPELTVGHLLCRASGLPDPLRGRVLPELYADEEYCALEGEEQARRQGDAMLNGRGYVERMKLMNNICSDGGFAPSSLDETLLCELVVRASGESLEDVQREKIFAPLGIEPRAGVHTSQPGHLTVHDGSTVSCEAKPDTEGVYTFTLSELERLMHAGATGELFAEEGLRIVENLSGAHALPMGRKEGFLCGRSHCAGWYVEVLLHPRERTGVLIVSDRPLRERREGDVYRRFDLDIMAGINALSVRPAHTRMERLSVRNISGAMSIELLEEERDFVSSPAAELAMAAADKNRQVFVATDGGVTVGMLSCSLNAAGTQARLETVMVDRRFRGRGFGRIMVSWCLRHLRQVGAGEIVLFVDHRNVPARELYSRLGFELRAVYDSGYVLWRIL